MTFYFKVTVEISTGCDNTTTADGLCIFNKNAMMFGSEVCSHVFSSKDSCSGHPKHSRNSAMPTAVVETLDPVALDAKLTEYGVTHEFITYPNSGHGLESDKEQASYADELMVKYLNEYVLK